MTGLEEQVLAAVALPPDIRETDKEKGSHDGS